MADKARSVRGTQDIFGEEAARFDHVVETFHRVRKLYGFKSVHTPVFEFTDVFARSIGETTDVVSKEMYSFEDRGGESLTLRPEFTAGLCRAYISNGWQQHAPLKLATHGPLFRYERPQKGRYRQFHQLDAEVIGAAEPSFDVLVISLADRLLRELKIRDKVTLQLNTLGDSETRETWRAALWTYFEGHRAELSKDSLERLEKNPLRILDSKDAGDQALVANAPQISDYLNGETERFFDHVRSGLQEREVEFIISSTLVRGLDYYRHTTFEFVTTHLGAQGTVIGGGRYDGLVEALGGTASPAVGWAGGIERLADLIPNPSVDDLSLAIVVEDDKLIDVGHWLATALLNNNFSTELICTGARRRRFDRAVKLNPARIIVLETTTLKSGQLASLRVKSMRSGDRKVASFGSKIAEILHRRFRVEGEPPQGLQLGGEVELYLEAE